jgi:hypothetical protein
MCPNRALHPGILITVPTLCREELELVVAIMYKNRNPQDCVDIYVPEIARKHLRYLGNLECDVCTAVFFLIPQCQRPASAAVQKREIWSYLSQQCGQEERRPRDEPEREVQKGASSFDLERIFWTIQQGASRARVRCRGFSSYSWCWAAPSPSSSP